MSLLGNGALMIWHDIEAGCETKYEEWHSKEHMLERVGIAGFQRGHRGRSISGLPQYINWYEVEDLATLTSQPYLDRLNDPTPWTQSSLGYFRNNNRTLCRVITSIGSGVTGYLMSLQLAASSGQGDQLGAWLSGLMPVLVEQPGVVSAHYLQGDSAASQLDTQEKRLREGKDQVADRVVLVGGYDADALLALHTNMLSSSLLFEHGASESRHVAMYQLQHCVTDADVRS